MHETSSTRACNHVAVDGEPVLAAVVLDDERERAQPRERVAPPAVALAAVDEHRVQAEREVVQEQAVAGTADVDAPLLAGEALERGERVVAVEPEVAREVVARAERDADERDVLLERDLGHRREGAVAAGHSEHVRAGGPRDLLEVLALTQDMRVDAPLGRRGAQLLRGRRGACRSGD